MGWSTVLIEIDGRRVLTDPIWSERCSPTTLIGPKRLHDVPIALAELPPIDAVVISHDHYDHLDMETIRTLSSRGAHFVVPTGIGVHLRRWRVPSSQITELGWNASHRVRDLVITATPSRHYSGRLPTRNNSTLWASWVIKGPQHRVFFSGDTGYFDGFKTIGAQHGPFDMTFIKIGAYDTSWNEIHFEPEPAVQTHQDLRGGLMLPIHWATFNLAFHAWTEPPERARLAAEKAGVRLIIPRPGEMVESDVVVRDDPWWR